MPLAASVLPYFFLSMEMFLFVIQAIVLVISVPIVVYVGAAAIYLCAENR